MTRTARPLRTALLVALLVVPVVLAPVAAVGAQSQTRTADLAIQQPDYVSGDVGQTTDNGTRIYSVRGEQLDMRPLNVEQSNVIDFGADGGTFTYDSQFETYRLTVDQEGTYEVWWTVNREVQVGNNSTEMRTIRYAALIRVQGGVGLAHKPAGQVSDTQQAARNWREFNSTIHSSELAGPGADTELVVQEMIDWYKLRKDPLAALTGNITAIMIMLVTTLGGAVLLLLAAGWHQYALRKLYGTLHYFEIIEAEEGTAKDVIEELDHREKMHALQNMDWNDVFQDDHVAGAFREQFGETVADGTLEYLSLVRPRHLLRDRLQAMGQAGYVAVVEDETATDGGTAAADPGGGPSIASARIQPDRTGVADDERVIPLADASGAQLDALLDRDVLDWDADAIRTFDLPGAEYDPTDLATTYETLSLRELVAELRADMRHFEDADAYGQYMREFLHAVREHPFTDDHGRPDDIRVAMSSFLQHAQLLGDRFDYPLIHFHAEAWERALIDFDPEAEAAEVVARVKDGEMG